MKIMRTIVVISPRRSFLAGLLNSVETAAEVAGGGEPSLSDPVLGLDFGHTPYVEFA